MKFGIICAGDRELAPFLPMLSNSHTEERAMLRFHSGRMAGADVVCLYSGVCKVNAAIATQLLIDQFHCTHIINAGTAGGIDPKLRILDTVISQKCAYHDVASGILTQFHPWVETVWFSADQHLLKLAEATVKRMDLAQHVYFENTVTGENFVDGSERDRIQNEYDAASADMETTAVAHVCYVNRIPFLSVRTITDDVYSSGTDAFEENCDKASIQSAKIVQKILFSIVETKT